MRKSIRVSSCILAIALTASAPAMAADDQTTDGSSKNAKTSTSVAVKAPVVTSNGASLVQPSIASANEGGGDDQKAKPDRSYGYQSADEYWTSERLSKATPVEAQGAPASDSASTESATPPSASQTPEKVIKKPMAPTMSVASGTAAATGEAAPQAAANQPRANGKVFFRNAKDGKDYVCSASSITSTSTRLVMTAGHCVHGGKGGDWHQNWVFIPAYDRGNEPYGRFQAKTMRTYKEWINNGAVGKGFDSDVAFVTTYDGSKGGTVNNVVGGHGLLVGGEWEFDALLFGYPTNLDNGEVMKSCSQRTKRTLTQGWSFYTVWGCDFGGGASGGPWLKNYDSKSGLGYVKSVSSHAPVGSTAYIKGPYLDQRITRLYKAANGD